MFRHKLTLITAVALAWAVLPRPALAQGPTIDSGGGSSPGGITSSLGPLPGSGVNTLGVQPGGGTSVLTPPSGGGGPISGRAGVGGTRVLSGDNNPQNQPGPQPTPGFAAPQPAATYVTPAYGSFAMPAGGDDDGPANGLTLDQAIEVLMRENLDLRGKSLEIPQAQADILSANLRSNPVFYADSQLIPYGQYTKARPGGQTQYDVNVSYPLDISRKRSARTLYATRAKRVIEAQYQDAVRLAIDQLGTYYVNVLAARQTVRYSTASVNGFTTLYAKTEELVKSGQKNRADLKRIEVQLDAARVGLLDAEEAVRQAKRDLAMQLNLPAEASDKLELRGTIQDREPPPPVLEDLVRIALDVRPDVASYRLGIKTAEAGVRLQVANRTPDWYLLYQPYTFQNNEPSGLKSPMSWALGITAPLPIYNRNQGAIARAKLNVTQSNVELASAERQAINDVAKALNEYQVTAKMVEGVRTKLLPAAKQVLNDTSRLYIGGAINQLEFLDAQREYSDTVKQYVDIVVRHRRAMLNLNTMTGLRILP